MNIVIISRTILPTNAPRAFRATELAKSLAKKGNKVTLMATLGNYDYSDFQERTGVVVKDIGTPSFALRNSDGKLKVSLWKKGVIFFLMKLLAFPDILLMPKVKKAILKEKDFDLLITIAVPYAIHWGASLIKTKDKNFKTWVSDCGDPFMGNTFAKPPFYFKYLEKSWCKKTDYIAVPLESAKESYYNEFRDKIRVIPQGFNFDELVISQYEERDIPTFMYAGLFYPGKRDPSEFLKYLTTVNEDFKFIVYTDKTDLLDPFKNALEGKLEIRNTINREELMLTMSTMDFLLNVRNKGTVTQSPSKLIDYSLAERPVLEISTDFSDTEKRAFQSFLKKDYSLSKHIEDLSIYDASNIADQFTKLVNHNG